MLLTGLPSDKFLTMIPHNFFRTGLHYAENLCSDLWKCSSVPGDCGPSSLSCRYTKVCKSLARRLRDHHHSLAGILEYAYHSPGDCGSSSLSCRYTRVCKSLARRLRTIITLLQYTRVCKSLARKIAENHHSLADILEYANHSPKSVSTIIIFVFMRRWSWTSLYNVDSNLISSTSSKLYPDNDLRNVYSHQQELGSHHRSPSEGQIREAPEHILQSREFKFTK